MLGQMHHEHLKDKYLSGHNELLLTSKFENYLTDMNEYAQAGLDVIMKLVRIT